MYSKGVYLCLYSPGNAQQKSRNAGLFYSIRSGRQSQPALEELNKVR